MPGEKPVPEARAATLIAFLIYEEAFIVDLIASIVEAKEINGEIKPAIAVFLIVGSEAFLLRADKASPEV